MLKVILRNGRLFLILSMIALLLNSCQNRRQYGEFTNSLKIVDMNGRVRNFRLFVPRSKRKVALLVYFHGVMSKKFREMPTLKNYTGSPVEETGLIEFCKKEKIALLVPSPSYEFKFLNVKARGWSPLKKEADGVERMIDAVMKEYSILNGDIFLAGISAGAVFSNFLANRRPGRYKSILSHSQGYIDEQNRILKPYRGDKKFGVVLAYTRGDYPNLKKIVNITYNNYNESGYRISILRDLPPMTHSWAVQYNRRFWRLLVKTGAHKNLNIERKNEKN